MCVLTRCLARVPGIGQQVVPLRCPDWCSSFSVIAIQPKSVDFLLATSSALMNLDDLRLILPCLTGVGDQPALSITHLSWGLTVRFKG